MENRLEYLLDKREFLEGTGRLLTLKQSKEIVTLRSEIGKKQEAYEKETS